MWPPFAIVNETASGKVPRAHVTLHRLQLPTATSLAGILNPVISYGGHLGILSSISCALVEMASSSAFILQYYGSKSSQLLDQNWLSQKLQWQLLFHSITIFRWPPTIVQPRARSASLSCDFIIVQAGSIGLFGST